MDEKENKVTGQEAAESGAATPGGNQEVEALRREVDEWRNKADDLMDKYRLSLADFANYRKRQERDREQDALRTRMNILRQFLPVVDDLHRAIKNIPPEYAATDWVKGVSLIESKFQSILRSMGVKPIEAVGQPFDPNYHSALMQEESEQYPAGVVSDEFEKGYLIEDQVLRPTLVKVSNGSASHATS